MIMKVNGHFVRQIFYVCLALFAISCAQQPKYATRTDMILSEINDPDSKHVLVICHRGDWRNYPENTIPAI